jgi:hypothetical protein
MLAGTALSAYGKVAGGYAQKGALDASASQLEQEAGQSVASGIQGAIQDRRRAAYVASNARAATAAGGLTTTGTSAVANLGQIRGEGEYRALTSLYQGYDRASELDFRASGMRTEGSNAVKGGWLAGMSTVLSGASSPAAQSFYDKYAKDTPSTLTSSRYSGGYTSGNGPTDFISG